MAKLLVPFLALWAIAVPIQQKPATRVIASTTEWKITASEFDAIIASFPADARQRFAAPANRRNLLNELIRIWVLSTDASKRGVDVNTQYSARRDYYAEYARQLGATISDAAVRAYYDDHRPDFERVRLSHILILNGGSPVIPPNSEGYKRLPYEEALKKAQEVRKKLQGGARFEDVAKEYSQDPTASTGGDAGYIGRGQIDRAMEAAAFALKVGEYSDVVGSIFGFHILRVTERKTLTYEELKDQIRQKLVADAVNGDIEPKVKAARVTVDESYFK